jgi:hypothetical protein
MSGFSESFLQSFDIHRVIQSLDRTTEGPIDVPAVVAKLKSGGLAPPQLTDEELAAMVQNAAKEARVPIAG